MTVIYNTNAGSSEKYAEILAEKMNCQCLSLQKSDKVSPEEDVVFIGWIMAGVIQGLEQAMTKFQNIRCVCAVGIMNTEKAETEIREKNHIDLPLFILPGAFDISKLKGMYKLMMNMMLKMMKDKLKSEDKGEQVISMLEKGVDLVKEENLRGVIAFLSE